MMGKREAVKAILEGKGADRIPIIMNAFSLPVARYGYTIPEVVMSPEKMTECMVGTRQALGYDGLCAGSYGGIARMMGGHLPNSEGEIVGDGDDVVHTLDDIKKLRPFDVNQCMGMKNMLKTIELMRKAEPDEPIFTIVHVPAAVAFTLMGAKPAFKAMIKNPELFRALSDYVEDAVVESCKVLTDAGLDFLWFPMPNFGGCCISRKSYEKCISESNIRANKKIKDYGAKIIIHTCGPYDDRFDLVLKESGDAWHLSDTQTKKVKDEYGTQVSLMGTIPCCSVLMDGTKEEVYQFAYQECMDGARDGRFILSGDCDVSPLTPDENIRATVQAAKDAEKVLFAHSI
ncbi:MAG: uroporphyrinogen decarboxylase family protein [Lachnospiraceae bacterium]